MNKIKNNLANSITILNLSIGFIGIIAISYSDVFIRGGILSQKVFFVRHGNLLIGSVIILLASLLDFFDGFVARVTKTSSEFGKQLDSFADLISFGVLPAVLVHNLFLRNPHEWNYFIFDIPIITLLPLLIVIAAVIRLSKYNINHNENYFNGLAMPAQALFWASFPLIINNDLYVLGNKTLYFDTLLSNPILLSFSIIAISFLMVSNIPLFSMKFKNLKWAENKYRYILVFVFIISFIFLYFIAIPLTILAYILISLIFKKEFVS